MIQRFILATLLAAVLHGAHLPTRAWGQSLAGHDEPEMMSAKKADRLLMKRPVPEYPAIAKMNYIQGQVRVHAVVGSEGGVSEAHVVHGHPFLAVAALKAIKNWIFKPAKSRPGPKEFQTLVDVKFVLYSRKVMPTPDEPERDLKRQVQPPELLEKVADGDSAEMVRMRVLVSSEGRALDSQPLRSSGNHMQEARRIVANWNFRPARWGAIAVPWYLDVDVPVFASATTLGGTDPGGR